MRGTEENFTEIVRILAENTRNYENARLKHYQYVDNIHRTFQEYGWGKVEFHQELNSRLGIATPKPKKAAPTVVKKRSPARSKKTAV